MHPSLGPLKCVGAFWEQVLGLLGFGYKYCGMRVLGFHLGLNKLWRLHCGEGHRQVGGDSGELGPARWRGSNGLGFGGVLEGFQLVAWASLGIHQPPF